jgi:hypothetical protein
MRVTIPDAGPGPAVALPRQAGGCDPQWSKGEAASPPWRGRAPGETDARPERGRATLFSGRDAATHPGSGPSRGQRPRRRGRLQGPPCPRLRLRAAPPGPSAPSDEPDPGRGPGCRPPRSAVRNMRGLFQTADQDGSAQRRREQGTKTHTRRATQRHAETRYDLPAVSSMRR